MSEFGLAKKNDGELRFEKSAFSKSDSYCVEVAPLPDGGKAVRDSKDKKGPVLKFSGGEWDAFKKAMKSGQFD